MHTQICIQDQADQYICFLFRITVSEILQDTESFKAFGDVLHIQK